jgi:hypothetical protein
MTDHISKVKNNFHIFFNPKEKCYLALNGTNNDLSLNRLRLKIMLNSVEIKFNYFITLTFAFRKLVYSKSGLICEEKLPFQSIKEFKLPDEISGKLMKQLLDNIRKVVRSWSWKYEEGKKHGRPHFHMIVKSKMCRFCLDSLFQKYWRYGFVYVKPIWDQKHIQVYISKEFTKGSSFEFFEGRRRWSTSRDLLPCVVASEWKYFKSINNYKKAYNINTMNKSRLLHVFTEESLNALQNEIRRKPSIKVSRLSS